MDKQRSTLAGTAENAVSPEYAKAAELKRQPEVHNSLDELDLNISTLGKLVMELHDRTTPVSSRNPEGSNDDDRSGYAAPVADRVASLSYVVLQANRLLGKILSELEV